MTERTLGRREVLRGAGVAAGGVALTGLGAAAAVADDDEGRGLSGSWLATRHDDPPGDPAPVKVVFSFAVATCSSRTTSARLGRRSPERGRNGTAASSGPRCGPASAADQAAR